MIKPNLSQSGSQEEVEIRYAVIESPSCDNLIPGIKSIRKKFDVPSNFVSCVLKGKFTSIFLFDEVHPDLLPEISIPRCQKIAISPIAGSNKSNANFMESLAYFISEHPKEILLSKCTTEKLIQEWISQRDTNILIAACFLAAIDSIPQNPLKALLEAKIIEEWQYEHFWTAGQFIANLCRLIFLNYPLLATNFQRNWDYPFDSPSELIKEIIGRDLDDEFAIYYLQSRYQSNRHQIKNLAKLKARKRPLKPEENQKHWQLNDRNRFKPNTWSENLVEICNLLTEMDSESLSEVAPTLRELWNTNYNLSQKLAQQYYQRECSKYSFHEP